MSFRFSTEQWFSSIGLGFGISFSLYSSLWAGQAQAAGVADTLETVKQATDFVALDVEQFEIQNGNPSCQACHRQGAAIYGLAVAKSKGYDILDDKLDFLVGRAAQSQSPDGSFPSCGVSSPTSYAGFGLAGYTDAISSQFASNLILAAQWMTQNQQGDGSWSTDCDIYPISTGGIQLAARNIITLREAAQHTSGVQAQTFLNAANSAVNYLRSVSTGDNWEKAYQLLGLVKGGVANSDSQVETLISELLAGTASGGEGWGFQAGNSADAFNTGLSLYALCEAGLPLSSSPELQQGIDFLLSSKVLTDSIANGGGGGGFVDINEAAAVFANANTSSNLDYDALLSGNLPQHDSINFSQGYTDETSMVMNQFGYASINDAKNDYSRFSIENILDFASTDVVKSAFLSAIQNQGQIVSSEGGAYVSFYGDPNSSNGNATDTLNAINNGSAQAFFGLNFAESDAYSSVFGVSSASEFVERSELGAVKAVSDSNNGTNSILQALNQTALGGIQNANTIAELQSQINNIDASISNVQAERAQIESQFNSASSQNSNLLNEIASQNNQIDSLNQSRNNVQNELDNLSQQLSQASNDLDNANAALSNASFDLSNAESARDSAAAALASTNQFNTNPQIAETQSQINNLQSELDSLDQQIANKQSELAFLTDQANTLNNQAFSLEDTSNSLLFDLFSKQSELSVLQQEFSSYGAVGENGLTVEQAEAQAAITDKQFEIEAVNQQLNDISNQYNVVQNDLANINNQINLVAGEIDFLSNERNSKSAQIAQLQSELAGYGDVENPDYAVLQNELINAEQAVNDAQNAQQNATIAVSVASSQVSSLNEALSFKSAEKADLDSQLANAANVLSNLQSEFFNVSNEVSSLEQQLNNLDAVLNDLQAQKASLQAQLSSTSEGGASISQITQMYTEDDVLVVEALVNIGGSQQLKYFTLSGLNVVSPFDATDIANQIVGAGSSYGSEYGYGGGSVSISGPDDSLNNGYGTIENYLQNGDKFFVVNNSGSPGEVYENNVLGLPSTVSITSYTDYQFHSNGNIQHQIVFTVENDADFIDPSNLVIAQAVRNNNNCESIVEGVHNGVTHYVSFFHSCNFPLSQGADVASELNPFSAQSYNQLANRFGSFCNNQGCFPIETVAQAMANLGYYIIEDLDANELSDLRVQLGIDSEYTLTSGTDIAFVNANSIDHRYLLGKSTDGDGAGGDAPVGQLAFWNGLSTRDIPTTFAMLGISCFGSFGVDTIAVGDTAQTLTPSEEYGQTITYQLTVKNTSSFGSSDTYSLSIQGLPKGWSASVNSPLVTLASDASQTVTLTVNAPPNLPGLVTFPFSVVASSTSLPTLSDSITFTASTGQAPADGVGTSITITSGNNAVVNNINDHVTLSAVVVDNNGNTVANNGLVQFSVAGIAVGLADDEDGDGVFTLDWVPGAAWPARGFESLTAGYTGFDFVDPFTSDLGASATSGLIDLRPTHIVVDPGNGGGGGGVPNDDDNDGVSNNSDLFPCDPTKSGNAFYPTQNNYGMLMAEDLWPAKGDFDYNDLVLAYNYQFFTNAQNDISEVRLTLIPLAVGAVLDNSVGIRIPASRSAVASATISVNGGAAQEITVDEQDGTLVGTLIADPRAVFTGGAAGVVNAIEANGMANLGKVVVDIKFLQPVALAVGDAPFDIFLHRADNFAHQIHTQNRGGTRSFDDSLFGQGDDNSSRCYVDLNGDGFNLPQSCQADAYFTYDDGTPAMLDLPKVSHWSVEGGNVLSLYPRLGNFAASGGDDAQDFFENGFDDNHAFKGQGAVDLVAIRLLLKDQLPTIVTGAASCQVP